MNEKRKNSTIAEFFKSERESLVRYVRYLIDDAADRDGEDVVQDVMLNMFNLADVTVPVENLGAYVYRSLKNRVADILKKKRVETVSIDAAPDDGLSFGDILYDSRYDIESGSESGELSEILYSVIDSLDEDEKSVIYLTEFESRSFKEISEECGVPVGTLLSRKSRAMKKIRNELILLSYMEDIYDNK